MNNTELISQAAAAIEDVLANGTGAIAAAAWASLPAELRALADRPAPQPHPEPIAWMVGTAFWWTKEEAERDAAETGLPIVVLGAMTGAAPAEQHQGEPVAWMDPRSPQMHATISNEVKQHNVKFGGAPASAINGYTVPLYTHAAPGDLEQCEARLHEVASLCATVEQERDALRAQMEERDALLREASYWLKRERWADFDDAICKKIDAALSASAEPSDECAHSYANGLGCPECGEKFGEAPEVAS